MKKLKVIICPAEREPYAANVSDSLEALQKIVGGYIKTVTAFTDAVVICNEEGRILGLPENRSLPLSGFCGDCLICGADGENFCGLSDSDCKFLLRECKKRYGKGQSNGRNTRVAEDAEEASPLP